MLEIIVQGRGGQGAQTAGNLLARAFFAEGRQVQAFATYGGARRGTPVSAFIRVDDRPIRLRCDIERADAVLCFDASLLPGLVARAPVVVVNSSLPPTQPSIIAIDAIEISRSVGLGRIVNSALLGAMARVLGAPSLKTLQALLLEHSAKFAEENAAACALGYHAAGLRMEAA